MGAGKPQPRELPAKTPCPWPEKHNLITDVGKSGRVQVMSRQDLGREQGVCHLSKDKGVGQGDLLGLLVLRAP